MWKCRGSACSARLTSARRSYAVRIAPAGKSRCVLRVNCTVSTMTHGSWQCVGGIPCGSCIRTGKTCQKQIREPSKAVFLLYQEERAIGIPAQTMKDTTTLHLDYFFAFLRRNCLVHRADTFVEILLPLLNTSSLLSSIASAIGALDAARHGACSIYARFESPQALAFKSCSCSIGSLKTALLDSKVSQRDDVLWATFFLGLFEVQFSIRSQARQNYTNVNK